VKRVLAISFVLVVSAAAFLSAGAGDSGERYLVRAIFDNASFVVSGEDVKVAGVRVGKIDSLDITSDNKGVVVLNITDPAFHDFRRDAECRIRPQSLIGEEFVECTPTRPRSPGEQPPAELGVIEEGEDGAGQRLLPVENTGASVDLDLINEVFRRPYAERLTIIVNELGTGLAGRGEDLNEVIRRANPALRETGKVLRLLARQNKTLRRLAVDSDTVMAPLARERRRVSSFVENASEVAGATAERREDLQANFRKLPGFLRELRPTMVQLGSFADQTTPVARDLRVAAPSLNTFLRELGPFSQAAVPALDALGDVAEPGIPAIEASRPIVRDLGNLARQLRPVGQTAAAILTSFRKQNGPLRLMDYIYFQAQAINGFDSLGHFLRINLLVNTCSAYATTVVPGCESTFRPAAGSASAASARAASTGPQDEVLRRTREVLAGADPREVLKRDGVPAADVERESRRIIERLRKDGERGAAATKPRVPATPGPGSAPATEPSATPAAPSLLLDFLLGGEDR